MKTNNIPATITDVGRTDNYYHEKEIICLPHLLHGIIQ